MQRSKDSSQKKVPAPSQTALRVERAKIVISHAGLKFRHKHHVFIAKLKSGEIWALNHLKLETKVAVTPLFEMWPPNPETKTKPAKSLVEHTTSLMQTLANEWTGLPSFIDTRYLTAAGLPSPASAQTVFAIARSLQVNAVPVTSPYFPPPFQDAIRNVIATDGRGVMFRLPVGFFDTTQPLGQYLDGLAGALNVSRSQIDILIDLEHRPNVVEVQQIGAHCLTNLPFVDDWRTVTVASGCFPASISDWPTDEWTPLLRADWNGWYTVAGQRHTAKMRVPSFGDYGVRCGGEPKIIPNNPAPNLRYTDSDTVWVRKGLKSPGSMKGICQSLLKKAFFRGATFSQGDADIAQQAAKKDQANGSASQWIQWSTNHHLEMVASQILSLP